MTPPSPTRRRLLRTSTAVAGTGALAGFAGCAGLLSDDSAPENRIDNVPEGTSFVFRLGFDDLLADESFERTAGDLLSVYEYLPDTLSGALDEFESTYDFDFRELSELLVFGEPLKPQYGGILWTDLSETELRDAVEGVTGDLEEKSYEGRTVYEAVSEDETGDVTDWVGVLGDGAYVAAPRALVKDVIDVRRGEGDSFGGTVREEYEAAESGPIRWSFEMPDAIAGTSDSPEGDGLYGTLSSGRGWLASGESDGEMVSELSIASSADAGTVATNLRSRLAAFRDDLDSQRTIGGTQSAPGPMQEMQDAFDAIEITTAGETVVVRSDSGMEMLVYAGGAVLASFMLGLGNSAENTPLATFSFDYDPDAGTVEITHDGGDHIPKWNLLVRGSGIRSAPGASQTAPGPWQGRASAMVENQAAVAAGDSVTVGVTPGTELRVVYEYESTRTVLATYDVPDV